jgi:hypothetical protein
MAAIPPPPQPGNSLAALIGTAALARPHAKERYVEKVEEYLEECAQLLPVAVLGDVARSDHNKLTVRLSNPTDMTATSVRLLVEVSLDTALVLDGPPEDSRLPRTPKWSDVDGSSLMIGRLRDFNPADLALAPRGRPGEVSVTVDRNTQRIAWTFGDVHPHQSVDGDAVTLVPTGDQPFALMWTATASNRTKTRTGRISLDVIDNSRFRLAWPDTAIA